MNTDLTIEKEITRILTPDVAWHLRAIPYKLLEEKNQLLCLLSDLDIEKQSNIIDELELLTGYDISVQSVEENEIKKYLSRFYRKSDAQASTLKLEGKVDFLSGIIFEAKKLGSSDIHIEVYEEKARIRIRVDGMLIEKFVLSKSDYPELINKIKIRSNLDITEKRLPQDGRIQFREGDEKFDIRVSVLPTLHGEKIVLRILSNDASNLEVERLGFNPEELKRYLDGVKKPHGIILISGPTGSGKTTTLYATLKLLNEEKRNVMTVEDPIEYTLPGINQVQLKENIGLTFGSVLRSFLRQDPDVIMVGEIRDGDTAQMAIRAALTGHLVLSTIHTNSAWGTISRLIDMGVPSYLLANTLNISVAQRLVRKLCDKCKVKEQLNPEDLPIGFRNELVQHYLPVGCDHCHYTGYSGRRAIHEVIPVTNEVSFLIKEKKFEIQEYLNKENITLLKDKAMELLRNGETSLEEVYGILSNE